MSNIIDIYDEQIAAHSRSEVKIANFNRGSARFNRWAILSVSALFGLWGSVCLASGLGSCQSLSVLKQCLFTALTGM